MTKELLLSGVGLSKHYSGLTAVSDVSVQVRAGEIVGLVGPNGAGKTTLVDIICGSQRADSGHLEIGGRRVGRTPARRARAGLARTFQHPLLASSLTIRENLLVGRASLAHGSTWAMVSGLVRGLVQTSSATDDQAIDGIAGELGLQDLNRLAGDLSLGEQRLVEVGRALSQDPLVLLLDEPFAGADAHGIEGIIEAVKIVQRRGHGVILVDHNVDIVAGLVSRMMLLNLGEVVFDGAPEVCVSSEEMNRVYFGATT